MEKTRHLTKEEKKLLNKERLSKRIWELDFIRGVCVLLMVFDHIMFDIAYIFAEQWALETGKEFYMSLYNFAIYYDFSMLRATVRPLIVMLFFFICGISSSFSRNNLKRGLITLGLALLITVVSNFIQMPINFGVLHMLAISMLVWWLIDIICRHKVLPRTIVAFVIGIIIIGLDKYWLNNPPSASGNFIAIFGEYFASNDFYSADYFPILPNVGYVLMGSCLAGILYRKKKSLLPILSNRSFYKPINFVGRKALWVYVLHQVVVASVLALISYFIIGDFILI